MTWEHLFTFNMKLAAWLFIAGGLQFLFWSIVNDWNALWGTFAVLDFILAYLCYTWNPETGFEPKDKE